MKRALKLFIDVHEANPDVLCGDCKSLIEIRLHDGRWSPLWRMCSFFQVMLSGREEVMGDDKRTDTKYLFERAHQCRMADPIVNPSVNA